MEVTSGKVLSGFNISGISSKRPAENNTVYRWDFEIECQTLKKVCSNILLDKN